MFAVSATAQAQVQIGYMDTQEVLSQLPEREEVQTQMDAFIQKKQEELRQRATEYQDAVAEYQQNQGSMSQQQIETREKELTEMQTSLDEFNQNIRRQVQQRREELLAPIFDRIDQAISTVAESEGLDFVLNRATNAGNNILFYASDNQTDVTQAVVSELQ